MQYLVGQLGINAESVSNDRGTHIVVGRKDSITDYFTEKAAAEKSAKDKAGANPGKQYAVFGILSVYETTTPKIIEKMVNDSGELVLKPEA